VDWEKLEMENSADDEPGSSDDEAVSAGDTNGTPQKRERGRIVSALGLLLLATAAAGAWVAAMRGSAVEVPVPVAVESLPSAESGGAEKWEYKIQGIDDLKISEELEKLGNDGWEIAFCRRALSGYGDAREGLYECIFKRRK